MSLNVYLTREEVNNLTIIRKNDEYFNGMTELKDCDFVSKVLKNIDKAKRVSDLTFVGRTEYLGALNKSCLSTGTKTLLNIYSHPNKCFDDVSVGIIR